MRPPNISPNGIPTITGIVAVGKTLTASTSGITDENGLTGGTFTYQWVKNTGGADADINGETSSTYKITASDAGSSFKVKVAFTDDDGYAESLTSNSTETVAGEANDSQQTRQSQTLTLSADVTKHEADNFNLTVTLSPATTTTVTVKFRLVAGSDGTAEPSDYSFDGTNTVTFAPNDTSNTINIDIVNDNIAEHPEFFYVQLFEAAGATIGDGEAKVTIAVDPDNPDTTAIVAPNRVQRVAQNVGNVVWTPDIDAFPPESGTTTVEYTTIDGTALAGTHYTAMSGTFTVNRWNIRTNKIEIPILNTTPIDSNKAFYIQMSNPANTHVGITPVFIDNSDQVHAIIVVAHATGMPDITGTTQVARRSRPGRATSTMSTARPRRTTAMPATPTPTSGCGYPGEAAKMKSPEPLPRPTC